MVAFLSGGEAGADIRIDTAREHYQQGNAYYRLDKFSEALIEYQQAYIAKPDPSFLYNIAQCHRLTGNRGEALKYYRRFLGDQSNSPNNAMAEKHVRDLEASLRKEPPGASIVSPGGTTTSGVATASLGSMPLRSAPPQPPQPPPNANGRTAAAVPPVGMIAPAATVAPILTPPSPPPYPEPIPRAASDSVLVRSDNTEQSPAFYTRWWFWTAVVAVAAAGVLTAVAVKGDQCETGRICQ